MKYYVSLNTLTPTGQVSYDSTEYSNFDEAWNNFQDIIKANGLPEPEKNGSDYEASNEDTSIWATLTIE